MARAYVGIDWCNLSIYSYLYLCLYLCLSMINEDSSNSVWDGMFPLNAVYVQVHQAEGRRDQAKGRVPTGM